jgi:integrase
VVLTDIHDMPRQIAEILHDSAADLAVRPRIDTHPHIHRHGAVAGIASLPASAFHPSSHPSSPLGRAREDIGAIRARPANAARARLSTFDDAEPATARLRLAAVKQFAKWLGAEGELNEDTANAIALIRPPKLDSKPVDALSDDELRRLIKACAGNGVRDKRDRAMVMLLRDTGLRASELVGLDVTDVDLVRCIANVQSGKGGRGRRSKFSAPTAAAIDRYLRAELSPTSGPLWQGRGGRLSLHRAEQCVAVAPHRQAYAASTFTGCDTARRCAGCALADPRAG